VEPPKTLYIFIDESGNFDFSRSGTRYYIFTAIITYYPWEKCESFVELRHRIISRDLPLSISDEYIEENLSHRFHATEDQQVVRNAVFALISQLHFISGHSVIVRKNKTNPSIRDSQKFYPKILGILLRKIINKYDFSKLCIIIDNVPVNKNRKAFIGALKSEINKTNDNQPYTIYSSRSESNIFLQITDYINWAVFRKWENNDDRSYFDIQKFMKLESDIFIYGDEAYY
jgi:hypothetical protein